MGRSVRVERLASTRRLFSLRESVLSAAVLLQLASRIARARAKFYGVDDRVEYIESTDPTKLPDGVGGFDFIILSAVFEHLLPNERVNLMPLLWDSLNVGGVIFINQTPHRWFPIEQNDLTSGEPGGAFVDKCAMEESYRKIWDQIATEIQPCVSGDAFQRWFAARPAATTAARDSPQSGVMPPMR